MASQRSTGAFVAGSVIGGIVGAAVALWKTPKSGAEWRAGLPGGGATPGDDQRFANPVLGFVEKAAAPIVGVELGKLAKDDPGSLAVAPLRSSPADAKPPAATDFPAQHPEEEATHDAVEGSHAHAASADELTAPLPERDGGNPTG